LNELWKSLPGISGRDTLLLLAAIPVLFLFIIAPQTFELSWAGFGKLGRGGLFFVLFFLGFDLLDLPKVKVQWSLKRRVAGAVIVLVAVVYFLEVGLGQEFTGLIYDLGRMLGASGDVSNSFLMATDYVADSIYLAALTGVLFGLGMIRRVITPIVFASGMLVFYLLDAFFPYGSLGPLQFWANFIVAGVAVLSKLFGLPIDGFTNHLNISGLHGYFRLVVYWPSVGVQSILIYSVVMVVIAAKLQAPRMRKLIYALVGISGTILLNVVRIFSIAYYGYAYATTRQQLDAFHNAIGEVLFPIWIVVFLMLIIKIEDHLAGSRRGRMKPQSRGRRIKKERGK
ncbi:MAG: exosortase/archaeosortase family protein, partial [Candidatus Bathyarchaeia archaeon]